MNALKSLVILSLVLTVAAGLSKKKPKCWQITYGVPCKRTLQERVDKEEWRENPETFQEQDERAILDHSNNEWNTMDFEMKNRKRASGYKGLKAYFEDLDQ